MRAVYTILILRLLMQITHSFQKWFEGGLNRFTEIEGAYAVRISISGATRYSRAARAVRLLACMRWTRGYAFAIADQPRGDSLAPAGDQHSRRGSEAGKYHLQVGGH